MTINLKKQKQKIAEINQSFHFLLYPMFKA